MPTAGSNSIHIRLDNKQNEAIGKAARERGLSPSELCRRLILEGMDNLRPAESFRVTSIPPTEVAEAELMPKTVAGHAADVARMP